MNPLTKIEKLRSVRRVVHPKEIFGITKIDFLFFVCPKMKSPGIVVENGKLTARYVNGLSSFTNARIQKVNAFLDELRAIEIDGYAFSIKAIFASADSFILFETPVEPPSMTPAIPGIEVVSNLEIYKRNRPTNLETLLEERPWEKIPSRHLEEQRLKKLLPADATREMRQRFVERTFAGFALDGVVIRHDAFSSTARNPVILGVESPGVADLQNAQLGEHPIPVVQLV